MGKGLGLGGKGERERSQGGIWLESGPSTRGHICRMQTLPGTSAKSQLPRILKRDARSPATVPAGSDSVSPTSTNPGAREVWPALSCWIILPRSRHLEAILTWLFCFPNPAALSHYRRATGSAFKSDESSGATDSNTHIHTNPTRPPPLTATLLMPGLGCGLRTPRRCAHRIDLSQA